MHISANAFWSLAVSAIFVQNVIFVSMLCSNDFFKAAGKPRAALLYGSCATVCTTLASALAWLVDHLLLVRFNIKYLETFAFVLIIALLEVAAEYFLSKFMPSLRKQLGKLLPVSAFSSAVLGTVLINIGMNQSGFFGTVFYGFCAGIGLLFSFLAMRAALERAGFSTPPAAFAGFPVALVTAGILSLAFWGFANIQIPF